LYAIVDADALGARDPIEFAQRVLDAGDLFALQWRSKRLAARDVLAVAEALAPLCRAAKVPFVVNDRPDIARLSRADAVHLGQDDLPVEAARRVVGALPIGCSTHDETQFARALGDAPAYVAFGPLFATRSKENPDAVVGLERLADVARRAGETPVVAIGGISLERASHVREAGAASGAVIAALTGVEGDEVTLRARALHRALGGR
jgi:thiamine-phosphate pyrophosphorylase